MPPSRNRSKGSRFPGARIKRIMQMDEEVGKLSASVPHMISKSLERFMQSLLEEGTKEARSRGSKKVTPNHLKTAIQSNPNFDFLLEKVAGIPDTGVEKETDNKAGPSKSRAGYVRPSRRKKTEGELDSKPDDTKPIPDSQPAGLPQLGTWKRDMEGTGGSGEGGRGMFDDYEEDEDDY